MLSSSNTDVNEYWLTTRQTIWIINEHRLGHLSAKDLFIYLRSIRKALRSAQSPNCSGAIYVSRRAGYPGLQALWRVDAPGGAGVAVRVAEGGPEREREKKQFTVRARAATGPIVALKPTCSSRASRRSRAGSPAPCSGGGRGRPRRRRRAGPRPTGRRRRSLTGRLGMLRTLLWIERGGKIIPS